MTEPNKRKQPNKSILAGLIVAGVLASLGWSISQQLGSNSPAEESTEASASLNLEGQPAPDFALQNLDGQTVKLSDYSGKVVFINFWATWCDPCTEEMPSMQRLRSHFADKPFEILAISLDNNPREAVPAFLTKTRLELNFPVLHDVDQKLSKSAYKTTGVPESFIVGPDGKVVKHVIGAYEWDSEAIIEYFEDLLNNQAAS
ncbi:MAG: redoxin domain-containing protein [Candidatus Sericytochromatia bacterium]|nr:redoxin domain-containing protein [Candidatus Sericytochromatia bacterium]